MRTLILRPSAKLNLMLRVGAAGADGYHDVRTLLQSISLHDTMTMSARRGPLAISARAPGMPAERDNLIWRAAEQLWAAIGRPGEPRDAHVKLDKKIPMAAGLGGGSADAAAALAALNVIWEARLPRRDLMRIAAAVGADVPFFLQGGTAIGVGRGDEIYPVDDVNRLGVVIVKPSFGVGTADAYRWCDEDRAANVDGPGRDTARAIDVGWPSGPVLLKNDLQAPVTRRHPEIDEIVWACLREGALGASMTGSGSAVFAVFAESVARKACRRLQRPEWLVLLARTLSRREAARRIGL
ncbi:MAG TPA: 4-(cytidine 5'-diphospho)-2-C-methyl-D-erythritol kinase [Vicinamibacterales bacterium]|nr:4-(cytidine 5'-diphospho)-2-C-methyl-D-erythritol kinase [Vicinamibacterales bacterium]